MKLLKCLGDAFAGCTVGYGEVVLLPEEIEDLWQIFNMLLIGDAVQATTFRKVTKESSSGSVDSQRVKLTLRVRVISIDFDPEGEQLRLGGVTISEHESVRLGSHHTLEIELHRSFTLIKDDWDSVSVGRVQEATAGPAEGADVAAIMMHHGLATLCLVSGGMSITKARLETVIPKRGSAVAMAGAKKAVLKWHEQILQAILRHVDFSRIKVVILGGPGFTKDAFWGWIIEEAARRELRELLLSRPKWVLAHASTGHKHGLKELLVDPSVSLRIANTKAAAEVMLLSRFFELLSTDPDRCTYGYNYVQAACEQGALETLLLTDNLFRIQNVQQRQKYVGLVEAAKEAGAKVLILSSLHVSGEQLAQLSGVAALLRFPLPLDDLVCGPDEDSSDEETPSSATRADQRYLPEDMVRDLCDESSSDAEDATPTATDHRAAGSMWTEVAHAENMDSESLLAGNSLFGGDRLFDLPKVRRGGHSSDSQIGSSVAGVAEDDSKATRLRSWAAEVAELEDLYGDDLIHDDGAADAASLAEGARLTGGVELTAAFTVLLEEGGGAVPDVWLSVSLCEGYPHAGDIPTFGLQEAEDLAPGAEALVQAAESAAREGLSSGVRNVVDDAITAATHALMRWRAGTPSLATSATQQVNAGASAAQAATKPLSSATVPQKPQLPPATAMEGGVKSVTAAVEAASSNRRAICAGAPVSSSTVDTTFAPGDEPSSCKDCKRTLPASAFSKRMYGQGSAARRCIECTAAFVATERADSTARSKVERRGESGAIEATAKTEKGAVSAAQGVASNLLVGGVAAEVKPEVEVEHPDQESECNFHPTARPEEFPSLGELGKSLVADETAVADVGTVAPAEAAAAASVVSVAVVGPEPDVLPQRANRRTRSAAGSAVGSAAGSVVGSAAGSAVGSAGSVSVSMGCAASSVANSGASPAVQQSEREGHDQEGQTPIKPSSRAAPACQVGEVCEVQHWTTPSVALPAAAARMAARMAQAQIQPLRPGSARSAALPPTQGKTPPVAMQSALANTVLAAPPPARVNRPPAPLPPAQGKKATLSPAQGNAAPATLPPAQGKAALPLARAKAVSSAKVDSANADLHVSAGELPLPSPADIQLNPSDADPFFGWNPSGGRCYRRAGGKSSSPRQGNPPPSSTTRGKGSPPR